MRRDHISTWCKDIKMHGQHETNNEVNLLFHEEIFINYIYLNIQLDPNRELSNVGL